MKKTLGISVLAAVLLIPQSAAQTPCPEGTLWEPYSEVCAEVRDVQHEFLPGGEAQSGRSGIQDLIPGSIAVGAVYEANQLVALNSGRLHTRMFVYPDGIQPDGPLPWVFTTATSRVNRGLEVVGIYKGGRPDAGQLGLFAWPCLVDYPCPDGDTGPGWQWFRDFSTMSCNITHGVDQGGHAQKILYYANHTDRLDDGTPPLYKSAAYVWNYCDEAWDLAWEHTYRQDKVDCSLPGSGCGWWGPGIEIFGDDPYPQIAELGFEDSTLYHDGEWSVLAPPETDFRDPARFATSTPWVLMHLQPNNSFGVGNWIDENDAPVIDRQRIVEIQEDTSVLISEDHLLIDDADVDTAYHSTFEVTVYDGDNYLRSENTVTPVSDFNGTLSVPVTVSDGAASSATYSLQVDVLPVNDAPEFVGQRTLSTREGQPLTITIDDVTFDDPDNDPAEIDITVLDGNRYSRAGNTITPNAGVTGTLLVNAKLSDGDLESAPFEIVVTVRPNPTPASSGGGGGATSPLLIALLLVPGLLRGSRYFADCR